MDELQQLRQEVMTLKEEFNKLRSSTTIPFDIDGAFRARLIDKTKVNYSANSVSNPPTAAELNTAFGNFATVGQGFIGLVGSAQIWLCVSTGGAWYYEQLTVAS